MQIYSIIIKTKEVNKEIDFYHRLNFSEEPKITIKNNQIIIEDK